MAARKGLISGRVTFTPDFSNLPIRSSSINEGLAHIISRPFALLLDDLLLLRIQLGPTSRAHLVDGAAIGMLGQGQVLLDFLEFLGVDGADGILLAVHHVLG